MKTKTKRKTKRKTKTKLTLRNTRQISKCQKKFIININM